MKHVLFFFTIALIHFQLAGMKTTALPIFNPDDPEPESALLEDYRQRMQIAQKNPDVHIFLQKSIYQLKVANESWKIGTNGYTQAIQFLHENSSNKKSTLFDIDKQSENYSSEAILKHIAKQPDNKFSNCALLARTFDCNFHDLETPLIAFYDKHYEIKLGSREDTMYAENIATQNLKFTIESKDTVKHLILSYLLLITYIHALESSNKNKEIFTMKNNHLDSEIKKAKDQLPRKGCCQLQ